MGFFLENILIKQRIWRVLPSKVQLTIITHTSVQCHSRQGDTHDRRFSIIPFPQLPPIEWWKEIPFSHFQSLQVGKRFFGDLHNCKVIGVGGRPPPSCWNLCCGIKTALNHTLSKFPHFHCSSWKEEEEDRWQKILCWGWGRAAAVPI